MNPRLLLARIYLPAGMKRRKLEELIRLTAGAFDADPPSSEGLSREDLLRRFAEFSFEKASGVTSAPARSEMAQKKLFEGACRLGEEIRGALRVSTPGEAMTAARILYRCLEIDLRGSPGGDITVRHCYFTGSYSPEVCRLMSALDAGILSGLAGGGSLEFTQRLTEGAACCRARFTFPEAVR